MSIKGYWKLNGNSNDYSGNGKNGTDTAITYSQANGRLNQGAGFNGNTSKIVVSTSYTYSGNITISMWVNVPSSYTQQYPTIFSIRTSTDSYRFDCIVRHANLSDKIQFQHYNGTSWAQLQSTYVLSNGWHYLTFVYNPGVSNGMKIYIDGILNNQGNPNSSFSTSNANMSIGCYALSTNQTPFYFNGGLDEVIFDSAIWSPSQIKNEYSRIKGFF